MTQAFQQMLQLAAMGATGHSIDVNCTDIDWQEVIDVSRKQKMAYYLAYALKLNKGLPCPAEIRDPLIAEARNLVIANALHRKAIMQLLEKMEEAGIDAVLLKGYAIADCYAIPECRMSSDTDIWVHPKDENRACEFMKQQGFSVEPRWKHGHHAVCHHPKLGCVELHVILYDEIVEEVWFGKMDGSEYVTEPRRLVEVLDGKYDTLGYTDHFIFLALHMIKHFIISGLTVQMMLDVALYFKKYADKIDVSRIWDTLNSLHYDKLLNCILWAMIQYCGFAVSDFPGICAHAPGMVPTILDDLEAGGWMGDDDKAARQEGWYKYSRQKLTKDNAKIQYWVYMIQWKWGGYKAALFPRREHLAKKYPYIHRHSWLIPFAWMHRLIFRGSKAVRNGALTSYMVTDKQEISMAGKDRVKMFRDLNMLD